MRDFLDIDEQIKQNEKALDFHYSNYQKTQAKISILVLIYSLIAIYFLKVIKYPFSHINDTSLYVLSGYVFLLCLLVTFLVWSIYNIYLLLKPIDVAYINYPEKFYKDIKEQYEKELKTSDNNVLNAYIKATYLNELEESVRINSGLFETRSKYYDTAFKKALVSLAIYAICSGFVIFEPDKPKEVNLKNYQEIFTKIESLITKK